MELDFYGFPLRLSAKQASARALCETTEKKIDKAWLKYAKKGQVPADETRKKMCRKVRDPRNHCSFNPLSTSAIFLKALLVKRHSDDPPAGAALVTALLVPLQGIPPQYRADQWFVISGAAVRAAQKGPNYYRSMVDLGRASSADAAQIETVRLLSSSLSEMSCPSHRSWHTPGSRHLIAAPVGS